MQGMPSTSRRVSPAARPMTALTRPSLSVSIARHVEERERHLDHALQVVNGDAFVGRVDVLHAVREVETRKPALVEDVCVGGSAAEPVVRRVPGTLERGVGDAHNGVVALEPIALVALRNLRLDLAVLEPRREGKRVDHLLNEVAELALVVRTRLGAERAPLR